MDYPNTVRHGLKAHLIEDTHFKCVGSNPVEVEDLSQLDGYFICQGLPTKLSISELSKLFGGTQLIFRQGSGRWQALRVLHRHIWRFALQGALIVCTLTRNLRTTVCLLGLVKEAEVCSRTSD